MKVKNYAQSVTFFRQYQEKKTRNMLEKAPRSKSGAIPAKNAKFKRAYKLGLDSTAMPSNMLKDSKYSSGSSMVTVAGAVRNPVTSKVKHGRQCTVTIPMHKMSKNQIATRMQGTQTEKDRRWDSWTQIISIMKKDHTFKECNVPGLFEALKRLAFSHMSEREVNAIEDEVSSFAKASNNMPMGVPQRAQPTGRTPLPNEDLGFEASLEEIHAQVGSPPSRGQVALYVNREDFCRVTISYALGNSNVRLLNRIFSAFDPEIEDRADALLVCKVLQHVRNEAKKLHFDVKMPITQ